MVNSRLSVDRRKQTWLDRVKHYDLVWTALEKAVNKQKLKELRVRQWYKKDISITWSVCVTTASTLSLG